jgi:hypothetical protein
MANETEGNIAIRVHLLPPPEVRKTSSSALAQMSRKTGLMTPAHLVAFEARLGWKRLNRTY